MNALEYHPSGTQVSVRLTRGGNIVPATVTGTVNTLKGVFYTLANPDGTERKARPAHVTVTGVADLLG